MLDADQLDQHRRDCWLRFTQAAADLRAGDKRLAQELVARVRERSDEETAQQARLELWNYSQRRHR